MVPVSPFDICWVVRNSLSDIYLSRHSHFILYLGLRGDLVVVLVRVVGVLRLLRVFVVDAP